MPLTQELLADALGLSVPHVNRTLRQLRDDDLVRIEAHRVIVKDVEALSALADFEPSVPRPVPPARPVRRQRNPGYSSAAIALRLSSVHRPDGDETGHIQAGEAECECQQVRVEPITRTLGAP